MKVKNSQRGFTLIEILLVIAVSGMVAGGIVTTIFQTFSITRWSTTQITALENIKSAAYRVSQDVRMAKTTRYWNGTSYVDLTSTPVNNLALDWTSWLDTGGTVNDIYYRCKYVLSGTKIQRSYGVYDPGTTTPTPPIPDASFTGLATVRTVSQYITAIQFSSIPAPTQGKFIIMTITSSPEGKVETQEKMTYRMYLQPKED